MLDLSGHHAFGGGLVALASTCELLPKLATLRLGKAVASMAEFEAEGGGDDAAQRSIDSTPAAVAALVQLLARNLSLTDVDLFNLDLGDRGARGIADVIETNATLQVCDGRRSLCWACGLMGPLGRIVVF
jgi:hypothetical protein